MTGRLLKASRTRLRFSASLAISLMVVLQLHGCARLPHYETRPEPASQKETGTLPEDPARQFEIALHNIYANLLARSIPTEVFPEFELSMIGGMVVLTQSSTGRITLFFESRMLK